MYRILALPLLVVLASISFNVIYFWMALQQGRISYNSVLWIFYQALTIPEAAKGNLVPWFDAQVMLRQMTI
jgi:hypothetical protein